MFQRLFVLRKLSEADKEVVSSVCLAETIIIMKLADAKWKS
jgi:hypothetical protein